MSLLSAHTVDALRCPATGERLLIGDDGWLRTPDGGHRYAVPDGIPILLAGHAEDQADHPPPGSAIRGQNGADAGDAAGGRPRRPARLLRQAADRLHAPVRNVGTDAHLDELRRLLGAGRTQADRPRVLVVGGATEGIGASSFLNNPALDVVETDVVAGPRTALVCDAHALPFADGTFDGAVCQGVLSVLADPQGAVDELHRVLAPGGVVYSETAFMQQVCNGGHDFTRWTLGGHRMLYRRFEELDAGAHGGPGMATAWSISYLLMAFTGRSRIAHAIARRIGTIASSWLLLLDGRLARTPGGEDAASGTYFLGRRAPDAAPAQDVVARYRGAVVPARPATP